MPARIEVPFKLCKNCKLPMMRKRDRSGHLEPPSRYAARQTCGYRCKGEAQTRRIYVSRSCKQCGSSILRKVFPCGEVEGPSKLRRRQFCDAECAALWYEDRGMGQSVLMRSRLRRAA